MAYATQHDLSPRRLSAAELVQLTSDPESSTGQANDDVIEQVLVEASAQVDSYCRQRYTVPLQASEQVKGLALDIAVYKLFLRRRRVGEDVQRAYDAAIAFLKDVSAGKAALDQPEGAEPQSGGGGVLGTQKPEVFSEEKLMGYE